MFEQVSVSGEYSLLNDLADALAYYNVVTVDGNAGALAKLCVEFGHEQIIDLIDADVLRLNYQHHQYGVFTEGGAVKTHGFMAFSLARDVNRQRVRGPTDAIEIALRRAMPADHRVKRLARELGDRVVALPHYPDIESLTEEDLRDPAYRASAFHAVLEELAPGVIGERFDVPIIELADGRFVVDVPVDFRMINEACGRDVVRDGAIDVAHLLSHLLTARRHLLSAATSSADVWLPSSVATLINLRVNSIAARLGGGRRQIEAFSKVVFDGRSFADAIANGDRTTKELVAFALDPETKKMKQWIAQQPPESSLVVEYIKSVEGRGAMDKVPVRVAKVGLFTLAGVVAGAATSNPVVGAGGALALNALDEFVANRIRLGWRPHTWAQRGRTFLTK